MYLLILPLTFSPNYFTQFCVGNGENSLIESKYVLVEKLQSGDLTIPLTLVMRESNVFLLKVKSSNKL